MTIALPLDFLFQIDQFKIVYSFFETIMSVSCLTLAIEIVH